MSVTHLDVLDRSVEKTNIWINEVAGELQSGDRHEAYRVLRAFLHTPPGGVRRAGAGRGAAER